MQHHSPHNRPPKPVSRASYFVAGGTLAPSAHCYLTRNADKELLDGLLAGEMCYVLNTRQMGKSSLMVRTAMQIREHGGHSILLDLTAFGQNLTSDQWYLGMLCHMGELTDLQSDLIDFWVKNAQLGAMQRFIQALRMLLEAWPSGPIVIFVDEIDAVRSLSFSTDEFFAAIRECQNRKAVDPLYARLTFCLIGVAVPTDLIRDVNATPFNIGRRIVLTDFTFEETLPFLNGMQQLGAATGRAVLERVLHWTGGQPYLTQKLCMEAVRHVELTSPKDIDLICEQVFLQQSARDSDPNLSFAQNRMLNGRQDRTVMLLAYRRSLHGGLRYYPTDPVCIALLLSGMVRIEGGRLVVRNRIYRRVFDDAWIDSRMPGAELTRQRTEYLKGLYRGFAISGVIAFAILSLFFANRRNATRALNAERTTSKVQEYNRHLAYDAQFQLLHDRVELVGREHAAQILQRTSVTAGGDDLRRFEWFYLNRLAQTEFRTITHAGGPVEAVCFSPNSDILATAGGGRVAFWQPATGACTGEVTPQYRGKRTHTLATFPREPIFALPGSRKTIQLWNAHTNTEAGQIGDPGDHSGTVNTIAISRNGNLLSAGGSDGFLQIWKRTGECIGRIPRIGKLPDRGVWCSSFLNNDTEIVIGCDDGFLRFYRVLDSKPIRTIKAHRAYIYGIAITDDGQTLATASGDGTTAVYDLHSYSLVRRAAGHTSYVYAVAFSHDGHYLTSGGWDQLAQVWDAKAGNRMHTFKTDGMVWAASFARDNNRLALGTSEGEVRLLDLSKPAVSASMEHSVPYPLDAKLTPDGCCVVGIGRDGYQEVWDVQSRQRLLTLSGSPDFCTGRVCDAGNRSLLVYRNKIVVTDTRTGKAIFSHPYVSRFSNQFALSGDGTRVAEAGPECRLWDVDTGQLLRIFPGMPGSPHTALNNDGSKIAIYDERTPPVVLNTKSGAKVCCAAAHGGSANVQFSADSRHLILIQKSIFLINAATGSVDLEISDPFTEITSAALSMDNSRLITAGDDHRIKIWDTATARIVLEVPIDSWRVISLDISDDCKRIAASLDGQGVRVWDAEDLQTQGK
jgi:WD40 repeat protein